MESGNEFRLTNLILPRSGHVALAYDRYVIVWGGYCDDPIDWYLPSGEFWIYDPQFKVWSIRRVTPRYPPGLSGATACLHGENIYMFGGHGREGNTNDMYSFDLQQWEWERYPCREGEEEEEDYPSRETEGQEPSPRDKAVSWFYRDNFQLG